MLLRTLILTPLSLAVLFIVMSWTERALDHQLKQTGRSDRTPRQHRRRQPGGW